MPSLSLPEQSSKSGETARMIPRESLGWSRHGQILDIVRDAPPSNFAPSPDCLVNKRGSNQAHESWLRAPSRIYSSEYCKDAT